MSGSNDDKKERPSLAPPTDEVEPEMQEEPATTVFSLPRFDDAALMPETSGKLLDALKSQISQLTVELAGSGIRHEDGQYVVLPKTLRSAWTATVNHPILGEIKFLIGQTRSIWVLLYDIPHEKVYEDPRFLGMELKTRDVAITPRGKRMYVSRIEKRDLVKLNAIAASDARDRAGPDTLAPTEGAFSYEDTMARLEQCTLVRSTDKEFDPAAFVTSIRFITPTQGSAGNFYYIDTGDPDNPTTCELHVGDDPYLPGGTYEHKATLSYKDESLFLYIDMK